MRNHQAKRLDNSTVGAPKCPQCGIKLTKFNWYGGVCVYCGDPQYTKTVNDITFIP